MTEIVFDEQTRRKLEQITLVATRVRSGAIKGDRRSTKRGASIEFADYRNYSPGDDLRRLDWNIYARLDRPLTKLYEDEEDLAVHLLLDASASMEGSGLFDMPPDWHKFTFARRLLAGLAYVSMVSDDRLTLAALGGRGGQFGPSRGRSSGPRLIQYINQLQAEGASDLNRVLGDYALRLGRPGLVVLLSDLFAPNGFIDGLTALQARGCEVAVLHVMAPDEIEPALTGDLRLMDVETGAPQEVSIDGGLRDLYVRRVNAWRDGIQAECRRRGIHYLFADTSTPWERLILTDMRRLGVVH
ncbi:MAG TPA: DUF58 domain-containing protein [Candidatus Limnocylindrales bacterium]|nr:DUF58 domain-containing protein [Candidatus Limnocylindrales bacterium]